MVKSSEAKASVAKDIDALFAKLPSKRADPKVAGAVAKRSAERPAPKERSVRERKPRGEGEYFLETGEKLVAVSQPRRFQDGLPVYKSFDGFSDLKASNVLPPTFKAGKCPFDCDCCF
jgi:hypothetical protein